MNRQASLILIITLFSFNLFGQGKYPAILWKIEKPNSSKPSYLFGTYHLSKKGVFKLGKNFFSAIKSVDVVASETNDRLWQSQDAEFEKMNSNFKKLFSEYNDFNLDMGVARKTSTNEKIGAFLGYQTTAMDYYLYRNDSKSAGLEEEMYLDKFITTIGYKRNQEIRGLENYLQTKTLLILANKESAEDKKDNNNLPEGMTKKEINDKIYDGYTNGNLNNLDSFYQYLYESKSYYKRFIIERNIMQVDSIDGIINEGKTVFAAVGSAHLPGEYGVIELLRKKGYIVTPVNMGEHEVNEVNEIKKIIVPVELKHIQNMKYMTIKVPEPLVEWDRSNLLQVNGYVDMANGAYFVESHMINNAIYFGQDQNKVIKTIDSLLYSNIKGDITQKNITTCSGFPSVDVIALVNNKDYEKYRIIVTPFEIIKLKIGGKLNYATQSQLDSFFNPKIFYDQSNTEYSNSVGEQKILDYKLISKNIDPHTGQLNESTHLMIQHYELKSKLLILNALKESFFSSSMFSTDWVNKNVYRDIRQDFFSNIPLNSGQKLSVRFINNYPNLYIITSISDKGKVVDNRFVNSFQVANFDYKKELKQYVDSNNYFSMLLPEIFHFDRQWKNVKDKKVNKPSSNLDINRSEVLDYQVNHSFGDLFKTQTYIQIQVPNSLEVIESRIFKIDSSAYFGSEKSMLNQLLPDGVIETLENDTFIRISMNSTLDFNYDQNEFQYNNESNSRKILKNKYANIRLDSTINGHKISFIEKDSTNFSKFYFEYIWKGNLVVMFKTPILPGDSIISPLAKKMTESFRFINMDNLNPYHFSFKTWQSEFKKYQSKKQSDELEKLNNKLITIGNINDVYNCYLDLDFNNNSNNILKRKYLDMIVNGYYSKSEWMKISHYLREVYENEKELKTLRLIAVKGILSANQNSDLSWVLKVLTKDTLIVNSQLAENVSYYFQNIYPKFDAKKALKYESIRYNSDILLDSGYFSDIDRTNMFQKEKTILKSNELDLQIKEEMNLFKFEQDKGAIEISNNDENFTLLNNFFRHFYDFQPKDSVFENIFSKILKNGTESDKLELYFSLLNAKTNSEKYIQKLNNHFESQLKSYYGVFMQYLKTNKIDKIPNFIKDKSKLGESYVKYVIGSNSDVDTIYFIKKMNHTLLEENEIYFYAYKKSNDLRPSIALVILPKLGFQNKKPYFRKTSEAYGNDSEKVMLKLIKEFYFQSINNSNFIKDSKQEKNLFVFD